MDTAQHNRILVTGGTGFLGSYLLRYLLSRGYTRIRAVRRPASRMDLVKEVADQIEWVEGDLLDLFFLEDSLKDIQQVYHSAAVISFDPRDIGRMMKVNREGTANLVNAALDSGIEKLVHVSSIAAIGRPREGIEITEGTKWQRSRHNSNYAISKYLAEQEVWRGMAEGLPAAIINPSVILGGGRWEEGPLKLFLLAWKNFPFYTNGLSGFVDVRDVARLMIRLMESSITGERYIVSSQNLSFRTIQEEIAQRLGKRPPGMSAGPWMQQIAWRLDWIRSRLFGSRPFITRETARHAANRFSYRNDKSVADLDFTYTPVRDTIAVTARYFQEAGREGFPPKVLPLI